jgi:hypothetical protein
MYEEAQLSNFMGGSAGVRHDHRLGLGRSPGNFNNEEDH